MQQRQHSLDASVELTSGFQTGPAPPRQLRMCPSTHCGGWHAAAASPAVSVQVTPGFQTALAPNEGNCAWPCLANGNCAQPSLPEAPVHVRPNCPQLLPTNQPTVNAAAGLGPRVRPGHALCVGLYQENGHPVAGDEGRHAGLCVRITVGCGCVTVGRGRGGEGKREASWFCCGWVWV